MTAPTFETPASITLANRELVSDDLWRRLVNRVLVKDAEFEKYFVNLDADLQRQWAERIVDQALGFLRLCADESDLATYSPAPLVDIGWHAFILYTSEYAGFCQRLAGRFIHHVPADDENLNETMADVLHTVAAMKRHGISVDEELWPQIQSSGCSYPSSCGPSGGSPSCGGG